MDRNVPTEDLARTAVLLYEGNDPPFSIRGPHSKVVFSIRKGVEIPMCLADARILSSLAGFRML